MESSYGSDVSINSLDLELRAWGVGLLDFVWTESAFRAVL